MSHHRRVILLLTSALVIAPLSFGANVTWYLNDVTFSDGATAAGDIVWNADTQTLSDWDISTSAGLLPPFTYTPADSSGGNYFQESGYQNEFLFFADGSTRLLGITPIAALTDAGGTVAIDLDPSAPGNDECFNCSPSRDIVSGSFETASPAPEPASIGLLGLALIAFVVFASRMRNRLRTRAQRA